MAESPPPEDPGAGGAGSTGTTATTVVSTVRPPLPECVCDGPGICPRRFYQVGQRAWEMCSGEIPDNDPATDKQRRNYLAQLARILASINDNGRTSAGRLVLGARAGLYVSVDVINDSPAVIPELAIADVITAWQESGSPLRTEQQTLDVLAVCQRSGSAQGAQCGYYDSEEETCRLSGYSLSLEAGVTDAIISAQGIPSLPALATYHCPIGKW